MKSQKKLRERLLLKSIVLFGGVMRFIQVNAQYVRGLQGVKNCYNNWISQIIDRNPNIWILGKDYLDRPVEGSQIKDYVINQSKN